MVSGELVDEVVDDLEAADLDLERAVVLDLLEKRGHGEGCGPGAHGSSEVLDGLDMDELKSPRDQEGDGLDGGFARRGAPLVVEGLDVAVAKLIVRVLAASVSTLPAQAWQPGATARDNAKKLVIT